jgi:hypothetical protein
MSFVSTYNSLSVRGWENNQGTISGNWNLTANLSANNSTANSFFGTQVVMSSDNNALAISQRLFDGNSFGAVNIYFNTGNGFTTPASARIIGPAANCIFGEALAISNNATYVITRATVANVNYVQIYGKDPLANTYSMQANFSSPYPNPTPGNDNFGASLSVDSSGTYLVVSDIKAPSTNAYVYTNTANSWSLSSILSGAPATGGFGRTVAINANGNTIAVTDTESSISQGGKAYMYDRTGNSWSLVQTISCPDSTTGSFGSSAELNAIGNNLIMGNPSVSNFQGRLYFYNNSSNVWSLQQTVVSNNIANTDSFGTSIAISESGNLIAVSSPNQDVTGNVNTGSVYIFEKIANLFYQTSELFGSPTATQQFLGVNPRTVAIGDYDTNPVAYMVAGAPQNAPNENGLAFAYTKI